MDESVIHEIPIRERNFVTLNALQEDIFSALPLDIQPMSLAPHEIRIVENPLSSTRIAREMIQVIPQDVESHPSSIVEMTTPVPHALIPQEGISIQSVQSNLMTEQTPSNISRVIPSLEQTQDNEVDVNEEEIDKGLKPQHRIKFHLGSPSEERLEEVSKYIKIRFSDIGSKRGCAS